MVKIYGVKDKVSLVSVLRLPTLASILVIVVTILFSATSVTLWEKQSPGDGVRSLGVRGGRAG